MTAQERMKMIQLMVADLAESIEERESAKIKKGSDSILYGYEVSAKASKEAINRQIIVIRQTLHSLRVLK